MQGAEGAVYVGRVDARMTLVYIKNACGLMAISGTTISNGHTCNDGSCQPCHESSPGYGQTPEESHLKKHPSGFVTHLRVRELSFPASSLATVLG